MKVDNETKQREYVKDISWNEIWQTWKIMEENEWRPYYEAKGFKTWEAWRGKYLYTINPEERIWKLYEIEKPYQSISDAFVGPFDGWKQYYTNRDNSHFSDMAKSSTIRQNKKVMNLVNDFPKEAFLIGLTCDKKTMLIDGTHRAVALTILAQEKKAIESKIQIALTDFTKDEEKLFNELFVQIKRNEK